MANLLARREPTSMQRQAKELVTKVGEADPNGRQQRIPIASIRPNPNQPRKNIDQLKIVALAENIRRVGLINPVTVVYREAVNTNFVPDSAGCSPISILARPPSWPVFS